MAWKRLSLLIALISILLPAGGQWLTAGATNPNSQSGTCPSGVPLLLGACVNVLSLKNVVAGDPRTEPCCSPMVGLANVQVADCLCFLLGKIPVVGGVDQAIRTILFACNVAFPIGFRCP